MKPCALTQSRARCVPTATRRPRPLRAAPVSAAAVTASQLLPRWRTRFVVPSATPIAGGDRECSSRRRGRLLTGQSWYRWPKEQLTPLLYHAPASAKSTFSTASKVFVDTALRRPTPTATRRVAGHLKAPQHSLLTRCGTDSFSGARRCATRVVRCLVAAPPHDSAPLSRREHGPVRARTTISAFAQGGKSSPNENQKHAADGPALFRASHRRRRQHTPATSAV